MRIVSTIVLIATLALVAAACGGQRNAVTDTITFDGDAAIPAGAVVTGTVTFDGDDAIPAGSVVTVEVRDVSLQDVASTLIASQIIEDPKRFPIEFAVPYEPDDINPRATYGLQVRITLHGRLIYINDTAFDVLIGDNPSRDVDIWVVAMDGG